MSGGHWGRGHHNQYHHHRHQRYSSYSEFKKQKEKHHSEDRRYQLPDDGWARHRDHDRWRGDRDRADPEPERAYHRSDKDRDSRYHDKWSELKVKRELPSNDCDDRDKAPNHKKIKVETDDKSTNNTSSMGKPSSTSTATSFSLSKKHRRKEGEKKYAKEKFRFDKYDKEAWKRLKEQFDKRKRKHKDKRFKEKKKKKKHQHHTTSESDCSLQSEEEDEVKRSSKQRIEKADEHSSSMSDDEFTTGKLKSKLKGKYHYSESDADDGECLKRKRLKKKPKRKKSTIDVKEANSSIKPEPKDENVPDYECKRLSPSSHQKVQSLTSSNLTLAAINRVLQKKRSRDCQLDGEVLEVAIEDANTSKGIIQVETVDTSDDDIIIVPCESSSPAHNEKSPQKSKKKDSYSSIIPVANLSTFRIKKEEVEDFEYCYFNFISNSKNKLTQFEMSFGSSNEVTFTCNDPELTEEENDKLLDEVLKQIKIAKPFHNLVLVVPSVSQMQWFGKRELGLVFSSWLDLSFFVRNASFGEPMFIKAQKEDPTLLTKLLTKVNHPDKSQIRATPSSLLMKQIVAKAITLYDDLKISTFHQVINRPKVKYLIVVFHLGVSNPDIKECSNLDSISFSTSEADVAWYRNIRSKGESKEGDGQSLKIAEALTQFLDSLETLKRDENCDKVALVSVKNDKSFPIFISHICEWKLLQKFLSVVGAVGSFQDCASTAGKILNPNQNNFQAFEKLYFKRFGLDVNFANNKNVTKYASKLFQDLFSKELLEKESFVEKHFYPVFSCPVNKWLCDSEIFPLIEDCHSLFCSERAFIKPGDRDTVMAHLNTAEPSDIGEVFYIKQLSENGIKIKNRRERILGNFSMMLELENKSSKVICLEIGEKIGMLSKDEKFMSLIGSETLPENETSNLSSLHEVLTLPVDRTTIENTSRDQGRENLIPKRHSKLPRSSRSAPDLKSLDNNDTKSLDHIHKKDSDSKIADSPKTSRVPTSSRSLSEKLPSKNKISFSEWKERKKQIKETEIAINTQSSPDNGRTSEGSLSYNSEDKEFRTSFSQNISSKASDRTSRDSNEDLENITQGDKQPPDIISAPHRDHESERSLAGSGANQVTDCRGHQAAARDNVAAEDRAEVGAEICQLEPNNAEADQQEDSRLQEAVEDTQNTHQDTESSVPQQEQNHNVDTEDEGYDNVEMVDPEDMILEDLDTEEKQNPDASTTMGTIDLAPVSPSANSDSETEENVGEKYDPEENNDPGGSISDAEIDELLTNVSPEPGAGPSLGTIHLEPAALGDSDVSLSDGELEELFPGHPAAAAAVESKVENKTAHFNPETESSDPRRLQVEADMRVPLSPTSKLKLEFFKESSRKHIFSATLKVYVDGNEVPVKLRKCLVKLVRLTDKELKLHTRQKVSKGIKEVWIQNKGRYSQGSSLRVAIKESLKMKNEAETKKNYSEFTGESNAKISISNKSPPKKNSLTVEKPADSDNENKSPPPPDKVKTLIDPQTPLVPQMKKIHEELPGVARQPKWMIFSKLSQAIPVIKRTPELEDLLWTFVRFYQVPISELGEDLKQFAEMLITDLINAGITSSKCVGMSANKHPPRCAVSSVIH